jgi:type II secretory pathway pseudopilin PulG
MSLVEIMIALVLTGILAILALPKFLASQEEAHNRQIGKVDQIQQAVVMALQNYEDTTGTSVRPASVSYERIFYNYGSFMAYKRYGTGSTAPRYYLLHDGTRLTMSMQPYMLTVTNANLPEYNPIPVTTTRWRGNSYGANSPYCGAYPANECVYIDINGKEKPNKVGPQGDLVPLRVNPESLQIKTLYMWHYDEWYDMGPNAGPMPLAEVCRFVSSYDVETGAPDAESCP